MTTKRQAIAVALAVWLTSAAWIGLSTQALPNHVVAGGVFGPGADVSPGPANPANAAWAYYYSTTNTAFAPITETTINPADGVDPAFFDEDVGAVWNWFGGEAVVIVLETVRGTNGWTGFNHTTSVDGTLVVGPVTQDFGNGTMELMPTLARTSGTDFVSLSWTGLQDANGNVLSYTVFRSRNAGPYGAIGTAPQGVSVAYNDTFLGAGNYCYVVGVDYRRDMAGATYTTTGRSEPVCAAVAGAPPFVSATNPAASATGVPVAAPIVVTFSEPMVTASVTYSIGPALGLNPAWSNGNRTLTLSHPTAFADCTNYTVTITAGQDLDGLALVSGPVPNPWTFTSLCPSPFITATSPVDGATMVPRGSSIVIDFSAAMNRASVVVTFTPALVGRTDTWSNGDMTLTIGHGGLTGGQAYTVGVVGSDTSGRPLIAGPVPNPFTFTANAPPTVSLTAPAVGDCRSGDAAVPITWTMNDAETPSSALAITLRYQVGATTTPIPGVPNGATSFSWTPPTSPPINGPVQILIEVTDAVGGTGNDIGPAFTVDSTAPTVALTSPSSTTNVPTDAALVLTFSEAMDTAAVQGALSIAPSVSGLTYAWTDGNKVLTVGHAAFAVSTAYQVQVGVAGKDACTPGMVLASAFTASFTTGTGPKRPKAPTGLEATAPTATAISLSWTAPTQYTDNSALAPTDILRYNVYRSTSETGDKQMIGSATTAAYSDEDLAAGITYFYWVTAVDTNQRESEFSTPASQQAGPAEDGGVSLLVFLIPLIVILLIVGALLLMRRKKPGEPAPEEEAPEAPEEAPSEPGASEAPAEEAPAGEAEAAEPAEAPAEESRATEESGEKFIPCANCGTMVKPTDVECFVCGAKL